MEIDAHGRLGLQHMNNARAQRGHLLDIAKYMLTQVFVRDKEDQRLQYVEMKQGTILGPQCWLLRVSLEALACREAMCLA